MWQRIKQLLVRVDELSLRERVIVFFGVLIAVFVIWDSLLMEPLSQRQKAAQTQTTALESQITTLNKSVAQLLTVRSTNPNVELRAKLDDVESENARLDKQLHSATNGLVAPGEMATLLEQVLSHQHGLKLISVRSLAPEPLLKPKQNTGDELTANSLESGTVKTTTSGPTPNSGPAIDEDGGLYKHGLQIKFEGSYADTLSYLQALEHLKWRFYWDGLDLEAEHYPRNQITITVHTLSLNKVYIGV